MNPASRPEAASRPQFSPAEWLAALRSEERRGELLGAFDVAERGLEEHPRELALRYRAVLALARAGATAEAGRRFTEYGLDQAGDEDVSSLRARIAKDSALAVDGGGRRRRAARAAELYGAVFASTGGYYPAINAATMWLLAGDPRRARALAEEVLRLLDDGPDASYWTAATRAEALLLLARPEQAGEALRDASERHGGDYAALASTRRQLRLICETLGLDADLLRVLSGPGVVYFCGHRIGAEGGTGSFPAEAEGPVEDAIAETLANHSPGYAYGSLAGGADILWAEGLLRRGAELHVVLPFEREEFIEVSVVPGGGRWVKRFEACLAAATEVRYATDDAYLGDDVLFRYCGELAMGLALLRARYLDAEVRQLAVWDGEAPRTAAGTAVDVRTWRGTGRPATLLTPAGRISDVSSPLQGAGLAGPEAEMPSRRVVRAMLFGDFRWFSKLTDEQALTFATRMLGAVADVMRGHGDAVLHRNTWGDGLMVVLTDVVAAATFALDLQEAVAGVDLAAAGLPPHLALRLGGHLGPIFPVHDPVLETDRFTGSHINRTARIEPVTPPGAVYVTEAFAAALTLAGTQELSCDYVGHMAAAKGYGKLRMHRLRRSHSGDDLVR